jgi:hypothetical protein
MDFISGLYNLYLKDRYAEIQDYYLEASDIQSEQLSNLLLEAAETEWGKKYDFRTIYSYQEFRERLPIQQFSELEPYLKRMKSGEANLLWPGIPKDIVGSLNDTQIPISLQTIEEIFIKGTGDSYAIFMHQHPDSKLLEGFSSNVGNGAQFPFMNELYALLRQNEPFLTTLLNLPKRVGSDKDGNPSSELVLQETLGQKVTSFRGAPEKLQALLNSAAKKTGKQILKELWPEAEVLFDRSPVNTEQLIAAKKKLPEGLLYQASYMSPEGFFGIQDKPEDDSFLLMLDLSTFFEFLPVNEGYSQIVPLEDIDLETNYQMVITNCSGLWRCCSQGPLLRFVSKKPYRFLLL